MKTKTKALIVNIAVAVGLALWLWCATGCDLSAKAQPQTVETPSATITVTPPHRPFVGPEEWERAYWRGVRDQAYAQHSGKPLNEVRIEEGRVKLYAPIEIGPPPTDADFAKAEQTRQQKLDMEDGFTVEKKGKK